jgi:hypothetical protein
MDCAKLLLFTRKIDLSEKRQIPKIGVIRMHNPILCIEKAVP